MIDDSKDSSKVVVVSTNKENNTIKTRIKTKIEEKKNQNPKKNKGLLYGCSTILLLVLIMTPLVYLGY